MKPKKDKNRFKTMKIKQDNDENDDGIRRRSMELCCDDLPDDPLAILDLIRKAGVK